MFHTAGQHHWEQPTAASRSHSLFDFHILGLKCWQVAHTLTHWRNAGINNWTQISDTHTPLTGRRGPTQRTWRALMSRGEAREWQCEVLQQKVNVSWRHHHPSLSCHDTTQAHNLCATKLWTTGRHLCSWTLTFSCSTIISRIKHKEHHPQHCLQQPWL